jgi:hypothetical protein
VRFAGLGVRPVVMAIVILDDADWFEAEIGVEVE